MPPGQVDRLHYRFEHYSNRARWESYYFQLRAALDLHPSSILEIGVGDGVFGHYVARNAGLHYLGVDLDPEIRAAVKTRFHLRKEFIPFGNRYHHFYVLEKKPSGTPAAISARRGQ